MNIKIFGVFNLKNQELPIEKEKMDLCFFIVQEATKNKLGILVGYNVAETFRDKFEHFRGIIPIELTNNPLESNANDLFTASPKNRSDRMMRIQKFLCETLNTGQITKITLDINIKDGNKFETIEINVNNFCKTIIELYEQKENKIPSIRIVIKGSK